MTDQTLPILTPPHSRKSSMARLRGLAHDLSVVIVLTIASTAMIAIIVMAASRAVFAFPLTPFAAEISGTRAQIERRGTCSWGSNRRGLPNPIVYCTTIRFARGGATYKIVSLGDVTEQLKAAQTISLRYNRWSGERAKYLPAIGAPFRAKGPENQIAVDMSLDGQPVWRLRLLWPIQALLTMIAVAAIGLLLAFAGRSLFARIRKLARHTPAQPKQ